MQKKLEKTKGKPVPLEYHYSTSIFLSHPSDFYQQQLDIYILIVELMSNIITTA